MAKPKKAKPDDVTEADLEAALDTPTAEEVQTDGKTAVTVTWRGGKRIYSADVHGKDFKALAKEFAEKKNGTVA